MTIATFAGIKSRHEDLYRHFRQQMRGGTFFAVDDNNREQFLTDVEQLLQDIEQTEGTHPQEQERLQLDAMKENLGLAKDTAFNIGKIFKEKLTLGNPLPATRSALMEELATRAYYLFHQRIVDHLSVMFADAWEHAEEEAGKDAFGHWVHGRLYFAHDLLYHGRDWTGDIDFDVFDQLRDAWLDDVVELDAYLIWRKTKRVLQISETERRADYLTSRGIFERRLREAKRAELISVKMKLREYLLARYLDENSLKLAQERTPSNMKRIHIDALTENKAKRIYALTARADADNNWYNALKYVRMFYENIVPALTEKDQAAKKALVDTFTMTDGNFYYSAIANCFEAAVLMYFIGDVPLSSDTRIGQVRAGASAS